MPISRLVPAVAVAACFSFTATAQSPAGKDAWAAFQREAGGQWVAQWDERTGTPASIHGEGLQLADWRENSLAEARRHAHLALQRWPGLLGLSASDFRERIGARMGRTWSLTFDQWFAGVPVLGGRVDVRIHMRGRLCHLGSTAWPIAADFDTTPKLDEATATAIAWQYLGIAPPAAPQPGSPRQVRLVIWTPDAGDARPFALAWEVPISAVDAAGQGPIGRVYVDAKSGAQLAYGNDRHECGFPGCRGPNAAPLPATYTVMGYTHTGLSPVSTPTNIPLPGVEVVVPGLGTLVTDQNGQFVADLAAPTAVTVRLNGVHSSLVLGANAPAPTATLQPGVAATIQIGTAAATEQPLAHTTTYHWTWRVNEWARSILGNSAELAVADQIVPTVNLASTCNAYYVGNTINFYASGGGCNNTAAASVVAHEWGHGLDDRYGGISQTNGLSEGWGDICSMYLLDDPTIGHDFFSGGGGIRTGTNTRQYPTGSGVHAQGESWMGFAWKLRQSLRAAFGTAQAVAISDDIVLGSIVGNAIDQPNAVLLVFLADDDDGNLANGTPHHSHLAAACQQHNLPYPQIQAGYLQHTPIGNTTAQLVPREVQLLAVPVTGSFVQARVHWHDGTPQQRPLIPATAQNGWHGLLPGQLAPRSVQYHFEAQHSNGAWLRLPPAGEFQYGTLAERRLWFDDFEAGGAGWTHAAAAGTDDWQIGAPAGRSGLGWADPAAAHSGAFCAGTDLSGDGAYAANSDTWLRSPPIDCRSTTGVRLRCRVWLSCEGPADQLEIRCNGSPIWLSQQTPRRDNAWQLLELTASPADNHPGAVFEFRLRSNALTDYGGWNLDDVELYTTSSGVALPATLTLLPEQAQQASSVALTVQTQGSQPFLLAIGDQPGPTVLPGIPHLYAGGSLITLFRFTDAAGLYTLGFPAPAAALPTGTFWHSHLLTLDAGGALVASNPFVNLFTQ